MSVGEIPLIRVLLLEDESSDAEFARRTLSRATGSRFEVHWVVELREAVQCLRAKTWDAVLLDLGLPECSELEALQSIRNEDAQVPIVVLTGLNNERVALEAIEAGAQDYLVKSNLTGDTLSRAIRYSIQRQQLLAAVREREISAESRAKLAAIVESSDDAIISETLDGEITSWNHAAEQMYGYKASEVIGKTIAFLVPSERQSELRQIEIAVKKGHPHFRLETRRLRKDGQLIDVALTVSPLRDQHGTVVGISRISRDISETKEAEAALRERMRLATLTARIGAILTRREDLRSMLRECTHALVEQLQGAFARIWTLNVEGNVLELQASSGLYTHVDGPHSRVPVGEFKIGRIAAERKPHLTNEVIGDPRVSDQEWAEREGMVAFAGYPLIVDDRLVGVMAMFSRTQLGHATLDAMAAVATQIGAGIERKRAEERLQFTQFTLDHVATPVFWANPDGGFFDVNEAACRLTGHTRDELLALRVSDINPSIPFEKWEEVWAELRHRGTLSLENNLRRKDGTEVPISVSSNLLEADGRQFSCTFVHDVTERQSAERALRESEQRFRETSKHLQLQIKRMPLAYILCDSELRSVDWNPAAVEIFGYTKDEVLGMGPPFEKIVAPGLRARATEALDRVRSGDMTGHFEQENLTKDGRTITCEWINTPLHSEDGVFNGLMCLVQDVTARKRLQQQFQQSQKMEAIGALAGGVAHEFNNLLQAIGGYTKFALEGLPTDNQRWQDLQVVLKSADRAAELTRQLLTFGRRQVLQRVRVDPNQVVADLVKMLRRLIGENIEVQTHLASDVDAVLADPGELQQALLNLCINARDAMSDGGRLIIRTQNLRVGELTSDVPSGRYVLISVADTGCGMSAEVRTQIFEPFFTTKAPGHGTGLGLAMVYGMVEQHGGTIHVYSEPGQGTTFKIYLPMATREESLAASSTEKDCVGGNETLLLAEDDAFVRTFLVRILERAGYKTLVAKDGFEALRMFEEHSQSISLVISDVVMPQLGGRGLYSRLKQLRPNLKMIFCTGHDPDVNHAETILKQGLPLLQKPVEASSLLQTVRAVLDASEDNWHSSSGSSQGAASIEAMDAGIAEFANIGG